MKAKDEKEKNKIKILYAIALNKALKDSKFESYRQLAIEAGMETAHIQRIATGKVNVSMSVNIAIKDALGLSSSAYGKYFDDVTDEDISVFKKEIRKK